MVAGSFDGGLTIPTSPLSFQPSTKQWGSPVLYVWAYLAGLLTLINPCVLPLLPIVIATAVQTSSRGPVALMLGVVVSFTAIGVGVTAFGHLVGLDNYVLHRTAAVLMVLFGAALLIPHTQKLFALISAPLADSANNQIERVRGGGLAGQFMIGALLGAVWSPCVGPTLGGAISLAASGENLGQATFTMLVFGVGVATVLLGLAYGSRGVINARRERMMRWMPWARPFMGTMLLLVGGTILLGLERAAEGWLLDIMPIWLQDLPLV